MKASILVTDACMLSLFVFSCHLVTDEIVNGIKDGLNGVDIGDRRS